MDKVAMLEKFEKVKELINGSEAENFKEKYFARFFSGDITLIFDKTAYTLTFHKGTMIDVMYGKPLAGSNFGLGGSLEQWEDFYKHGNFQFATSAKRNPHCFEFLGSSIAFRQNNNVIAHLMRVIAMVMSQ